jgi:preprotein translocase subunit SecA
MCIRDRGNTKDYVLQVAGEIAEGIANDFLQDKGERDLPAFRERVEQLFAISGEEVEAIGQLSQAQATVALAALVQRIYAEKDDRLGGEGMRSYERWSILQIIDAAWKRHLLVMDHLKEAIGFRGYGQKDPLVEYKRESYEYFEQMRFGYEDEIIAYLYRVEPQPAYVPDEDFFKGPSEVFELGPDEQGNPPEGFQLVIRLTLGGLEE